jgi:hypothetical protein
MSEEAPDPGANPRRYVRFTLSWTSPDPNTPSDPDRQASLRRLAHDLGIDAEGDIAEVAFPLRLRPRSSRKGRPPAYAVCALVIDRTEPGFVPTPVQAAILKVLDGRALRQAELERETGYDRRQLQRETGLGRLRGRGMVRLNRRIGFYRPDAPPPGFVVPG